MKDYFEIVTLRDCKDCGQKKGLGQESGMSPIDIILGGVDFIMKVFGFGNQSRALTSQDWYKLFPSNGIWTTRLRNYLSSKISWDTDLKNIEPYTQYFVHENLFEISGGKYNNLSTVPTSSEWASIMSKFYQMLNAEKSGSSNGYTQAGMFGEIGILPLLLLGGLAYGFLSSPSKKRKVRK